MGEREELMYEKISESTNFAELVERPEWHEIKRRIVKAINSHESLLEAAKIGLSYMRPGEHYIVYGTDLKTVKSAIAQAEAKS